MPLNWSLFKKVFVTFEICLLTFSVYVGSAIYSAGTETVVKDFGVSQTKATLGLTLFVAGYGLGPMIWAPMSEIPQIGRNPIYIGTLAVFVILQVPTALATNFAMLLCFRFLTGFIGSPVLATGGASIGDMFAPNKRAYGIAIWGIAAICGPVLGPLVGGFAAQAEGWTWTIWELMWLCGFSLILFIFFLPETSSSNILFRRTRRLRKLTGIQSLRCQPEIMSEHMTGKDVGSYITLKTKPDKLTCTSRSRSSLLSGPSPSTLQNQWSSSSIYTSLSSTASCTSGSNPFPSSSSASTSSTSAKKVSRSWASSSAPPSSFLLSSITSTR